MRPVDRISNFRANVNGAESHLPAPLKPARPGPNTDSPAQGVAPGSVVTLSGSSRVSTVARRAVEAAPAVRSERVAELRAAISAGRYVVDPAEIAARIVAAAL